MKIEGKLYQIGETKQVSATFKKREFVVEYAENPLYPEFIRIEVAQERCFLLEELQVGDWVEVDFNLRGRRWTNQEGEEIIFNSVQAWRIKKGQAPETHKAEKSEPALSYQMQNIQNSGEDLPF